MGRKILFIYNIGGGESEDLDQARQFGNAEDLDQARQFGNAEDLSAHPILDSFHFTWKVGRKYLCIQNLFDTLILLSKQFQNVSGPPPVFPHLKLIVVLGGIGGMRFFYCQKNFGGTKMF